MANNLNDSMNNLEAAFRQYSTKFSRFTRSLDKLDNTKDIGTLMTKLIAVGREDVLTTNSLSREFRMTGLALTESFSLFHTNIQTGFRQYDKGSKRLLSTVVKLGLSERLFSDMLAFNTEVLGQNVKGSAALADHIVSMGREFHVDANALVSQLKSLDSTTRRVALQSGGDASMNLQRVATTVGAALGPQYFKGMGELVGLVAGTTLKDYSKAAVFGGTTGVGKGASPKDILSKFDVMTSNIVSIATDFGVFSDDFPAMASLFEQSYGISKEMLQLARKYQDTQNIGDSLGTEIAEKMGVEQLKTDISRNLTKITASFQSVILPYALEFTRFLAQNAGVMADFAGETLDSIKRKLDDWDLIGKFDFVFTNLSSYFKDSLKYITTESRDFYNLIEPKIMNAFAKVEKWGEAGIEWFRDFKNSTFSDFLRGDITFLQMTGADELPKKAAVATVGHLTTAAMNAEKLVMANIRNRGNQSLVPSDASIKERQQIVNEMQKTNPEFLSPQEYADLVEAQALAAKQTAKAMEQFSKIMDDPQFQNAIQNAALQKSINSINYIGSLGVFGE